LTLDSPYSILRSSFFVLDGFKGPLRPAGRVSLPLAWPFVGTRFLEHKQSVAAEQVQVDGGWWSVVTPRCDEREGGAAGSASMAATPARRAPGANPQPEPVPREEQASSGQLSRIGTIPRRQICAHSEG